MRERKRERKRERERELDDSEFKGANTIRNFDVGDERAIQKKTLSHPPRNVPHRLAASPSLGPRLKSVMAAISRRGGVGRERERESGREKERAEGRAEWKGSGSCRESTEKWESDFFCFRLLSTSTSAFSFLFYTFSRLNPKSKTKNTTAGAAAGAAEGAASPPCL